MTLITQRKLAKSLIAGLALAGLALSAPASAQRDPAYEAARRAGQIGEKMDGYLAVVGNQPASVEAMVADLNRQRRENYTNRAQNAKPPATLEEYALTQGCVLIGRTAPGEKYQAPDGSWQTRGEGPFQKHPRCP